MGSDFLAWMANAPDDLWAAANFWRLSERFPDWWQFKAYLMGASFLLLLMYPRSLANLPARVARAVAALGALIIFATLFNQGLGWLGDCVFVIGFFGMCLDTAIRGTVERRALARALEETLGIRKMTPERATYLAVTGRLSEAVSEAKSKAERVDRR